MSNTENKSVLYLMAAFDGGPDVKGGISGVDSIDSRHGSYQNALGPRFLCKWDRCWVGDAEEIARLERELKKHFKDFILHEGRGYTEWISGLTVPEVAEVVTDLIEGHRFKVEPVEEKYLPLTSLNLDEFRQSL